jgi:beta-glucosidase
VADDAGASPLARGIGESQSHRLTLSPIDKVKQEDARQLRWSGTGQASVEITGAAPINLTRQTNAQIALGFDYRVQQPPSAAVSLGMGCGASCAGTVALAPTLAAAPRGTWRHLDVPLACFGAAGENMARVWTPFTLATSGKLTLDLANIRLESGAAHPLPCGH